MKEIAIFQKDLKIGGIQKSLINLLNNIDLNKYNVDLYIFDRANFYENELDNRINIIYLNKYNYLNRLVFFDVLKKIKKVNITKSYDIAIDYNSYSNECAIHALKVNAKKRYIYAHNDVILKSKNEIKYRILTFFFQKKYLYFDKIIAVSKGVKESIIEKYNFHESRIEVIPNYIDTKEIIEKSEEKVDFAPNPEHYNLVTIGRLVHQKGFDLLIKEMREIVAKNNNIDLYIVGDGEEKNRIKNLIEKYNLKNNVHLLGSRKNPYSILKLMDGFILTSRYEGQGIVLLEAKCLGLDIFIPKRLEKYNENIKGTNNLVEEVVNATKKEKKVDKLTKYNDDIIKKIEKILEV